MCDVQLDAISPEIPGSLPIYNIDELMPWTTQPESKMMDAMLWLEQNAPDLAELCVDPEEDAPPFPGARPILRWSMTAVRLAPITVLPMASLSLLLPLTERLIPGLPEHSKCSLPHQLVVALLGFSSPEAAIKVLVPCMPPGTCCQGALHLPIIHKMRIKH